MTTENQTPPEDPNYQPPGDENDGDDAEQAALVKIDQTGLASIAKSEAMAQVDVAHAYPRSIGLFLEKSIKLATLNVATAKSCMYTLKRKEWDPVAKKKVDKLIVGPSIRLAEIAAHCFQNIHSGARPVAVGDTTVTCQGIAWDLENNVRVTKEVSRRITGKGGRRYGDDMIVLTINACCAIAQRNAILGCIPRAYVNEMFERIRYFASGGTKPIEQKRQDIILAFAKYGVHEDRILQTLGIQSVDKITIEHIEALIGLGTRLKEGDSIDELFPPPPKDAAPVPGADQEGQKIDLGKKEPAASTEVQKQEVPADKAAQPQPTSTQPTPTAEKPAAKPKRSGGAAELSFTLKDPERAAGEPTPGEIAKMGPQPVNKDDDGTGIS